MGVLQEFERRLEGAVEGFFARAFRSGLQPVELAKALQRYIADHQHVTADGVVMPNVFRVTVGPKDHDRLSSFGASLPRELGEVVAATAAERRWILRGPVKVRVDKDNDVRVGRYRVQARVEVVDAVMAATAASGPSNTPGFDQTQIVTAAVDGRLRLVVKDGEAAGSQASLVGERLTIGRHSTCNLPIDDSTVSREHAAVVRRGSSWWIVDLGSTNGTRVNGSAAVEREIHPGDVIEVGGVSVELMEA